MKKILDGVSVICREAGKAILKVYEREDLGIEIKADNSPLTDADLAAHDIILAGLKDLAPAIPVLSEESEDITFATRQRWDRYFLVDPLDGTKEFINRNGEFTVNIALIEEHVAVLGVVYVPVQDVLYSGVLKAGETRAYVEREGSKIPISVRQMNRNSVTVVASRRHGDEALKQCIKAVEQKLPVEIINIGSSLKFCMIAEGLADLYPRLAPTSEWDTAAAQAVVEAAGGQVVDRAFKPLRYNTKENILNPHFYVIADPDYGWQAVLP